MSDLQPFCYGEELHLRDSRCPNAKVRDWSFYKREGGKIFLEDKDKGYVWEARMDDIDWEVYRKGKAID